MPLYRVEVSSSEPDVFTTCSYWADEEAIAQERAARQFKVAMENVIVYAVDPVQGDAMGELERNVGRLFSIRAEWSAGELVRLDLGEPHCCWGDTIDSDLKVLTKFRNLKDLSLRGNLKISDAGLAVLAELPRLECLILDEMQIGDACTPYLQDLVHLQTLYLAKSTLYYEKIRRTGNITDAGLRSLAELRKLRSFSLAFTEVTGEGFDAFESFPQIEHLFLELTPFNDKGMVNLARMPRLKQLHLSNTNITDTGLGNLSQLQQLEILYLDEPPSATQASESYRDSNP